MKIDFHRRIIPCLRAIVGIFFTISGGMKLIEFEKFTADIELYGIVTGIISVMAAWSIILVEIAAGVLWIVNKLIEESGAALIVLLLLFNFAMSYNIIRGNIFDCGCFGTLMKSSISYWSLLRNFILIFVIYAVGKRD